MATMTVADCSFGRDDVVVEDHYGTSNKGPAAHPAGEYEGGRRFAPARYDMEIDNRCVRHIGRGRVVRRLPATKTLPPRVQVEMAE